eukprot:CAMPEP_0194775648 /NCGR_PEP_ID=MMETSP0323_2-20130528/60946_1 /TAXON_ID=2866 ORGANISM="Crypthecodinium cohnii, Strain Seligo" /NCGR_SAMPLE_ID=MMETSP0323_2 /ASSEMBLY_ACC=CAM_ASM_000346 /LENGTH=108 /DNA_ID=CAMNT_0039711727 /DNA_START=378 /DNA_END=700 /DNA_ORIENTATION=-
MPLQQTGRSSYRGTPEPSFTAFIVASRSSSSSSSWFPEASADCRKLVRGALDERVGTWQVASMPKKALEANWREAALWRVLASGKKMMHWLVRGSPTTTALFPHLAGA